MHHHSFLRLLLVFVVVLGSISTVSSRVSFPMQPDSRFSLSTYSGHGRPPIFSTYAESNPAQAEVHPSLVRRHNQFLSMLHRLAPSDSHAKRSLAAILATGIHFIFQHFDIIFASYMEAEYMSDLYRDMIANLSPEIRLQRERQMVFDVDPTVFRHVLTYGYIKILVAYARDKWLTAEVVENVIFQFATVMLEVTRYVAVVLPFQLWALVNGAWILIQALIEEFVDPAAIVGG